VTQSISGLASGLDTTSILNSLMALERQPQDRLKSTQATVKTTVAAYQALSARLLALSTTSTALATTAGWQVAKATSSSAAVVAQARSGALTGTLAFTVDRLATAHALVSTGSVSDRAQVVATGPVLLAAATGLGLTTVAGSGLTAGPHTLEVTQASAGASAVGASPLAGSTTITAGVNDTVDVDVDGVATTLTIAAGTYSGAQLATAITSAAAGALSATVEPDGRLRLTTTREGSAASLQVTGGSALAALRLAPDPGAHLGTDGVITVDGTATTLTDLAAGGTAVLAAPTGSITATFGGGVRVGQAVATSVDVGDGSLASVVGAINAAAAGVTATAVRTGVGAYRLQLASTTTGAGSTMSLDPSTFAGALGPLAELTAAQDARITVGTGPGAYSVASASNTLTDLLPGVTLALTQTTAADAPVTVTVAADRDALADRVAGMVSALNDALGAIRGLTSYDPSTKVAGPLLGDLAVRRLGDSLVDSVINAVGSSSLGRAGQVGLSVQRDGSVAFDKAKFLDAYATNPTAVAALFTQGGTATSPKVAFASSTARTLAGTYAVTVTQAAQPASVTGAAVGGGAIAAAETIDLQVGSTTVSYAAAAGESLASIAAGINTATAAASLGVVASVVGGALQLRSADYGSAAAFSVRTSVAGAGQTGLAASAGSFEAHAGLDVAGTVNGVAATGRGQYLTASPTDATLAGLSILVTATAADVSASTDFGTVTYSPGVAQRFASVTKSATDLADGSLTTAVRGQQDRLADLARRIADWDVRLAQRQTTLKKQYTDLETALSQMRSQSTWLAAQLSQLSTNSSGSG
jgi:flagellar hook-associated protein 2